MTSARLSDLGVSIYQNPQIPTDVNADDTTTPEDVLLILNAINRQGTISLDRPFDDASAGGGEGETSAVGRPPFLDVSGDYAISSLDILLVICKLPHDGVDAAKQCGELGNVARACSLYRM